MSWHTGRMVLLDFETSGIDCFRDRVVTAALIEVGGGRDTVTREWLINPGIEIPAEATAVHGVSTMQAQAGGVDPAGAIHEIATHLVGLTAAGVPVVGHNIGGYDLTMLWAELLRYSADELAAQVAAIRPVIDTMVIEKHLDPFRPGKPNGRRPDEACGSHRLIDCCRLWGVPLSEQEAHGATADALAAGRLAWRLATDPMRFCTFDNPRRPTQRIDPAALDLAALHAWQVNEKRSQADSFGAYLVKQGKPDDISREWPIQSPPADWSPEQLPAPREERAS